MASSTTPRPFDEIESDVQYRLVRNIVRLRLIGLAIFGGLMIWLGLSQPPLWRQVALTTLGVVALAVSIWDFFKFRRTGVTAGYPGVPLPGFIFSAAAGHVVFITCTGGMASPFLPAMVLVPFLYIFFARPRLATWLVYAFEIPVVFAIALASTSSLGPELVPPILGGGPDYRPPPPVLVWTCAAVLAYLVLAMYGHAIRVRASFDEVLHRTSTERDRSLEMYAEQNRALTTLSGEIAHELKNPLASVKGLAALIAMDLEGPGTEQLQVLRREVDRMQSVLDEFLNFSRPLVPLAQERLDVVALCREAAAMHEGLAAQKEVALSLVARGPIEATCDARKVIQILVNLLQNALDASPQAGTIVIDVKALRNDGNVVVTISDQGPGLSSEVAQRHFVPGVTDKPKGSGLGLTIARALARQHGGNLTLDNADSGGCVARLVLPVAPPPAESDPASTPSDDGGSPT